MSGETEYYTQLDRLAFNRFAQTQLELPVLDFGSENLDLDSVQGFALASIRDYFAHAYHNHRPNGDPFRVYPGYIATMAPDAFAAEMDDVHLCGVHVGLAESFLEFALFCFSQETLFPAIGDPSRETSPKSVSGFTLGKWLYHLNTEEEYLAFMENAKALKPTDPTRQMWAGILAVHMLRFVWFHELCHCLNGHVGYAKKHQMALFLHENGLEETSKISPRDMQCMELDADQSAIYFQCLIQSNSMENLHEIKELPLEERVAFTIFATYATNWIIEDYSGLPKALKSADHPEPHLRFQNLITTLSSNVRDHIPNIEEIHHQTLDEVERASRVIEGFPNVKRVSEGMQNPEFHRTLDDYQEDLTKLRNDMKEFRYTRSD